MVVELKAVLKLKDEMSSNLKKIAGAATVGFAAIGAAAVAATNKFAEIDAELRRTASLSGATAAEFTQLTEAAKTMGSNSTKSMLEISQSMSELAANGMTANEVMAAMPGIISASEASGESLAIAASTVSAALNSWNLEASESGKVADILTMAANVSAAGINDMSMALKYAGAPAAALGMDLAEVSAAIGAMLDSGIDGSSAGTALRAALLALNNPAKTQAKIMDKLGISVTDAAGEAKSMVDIVRNMEEATRDMTQADRLATVAKLVGTEAASGFLALMSRGPDELSKMTDALRDSDGLAQATADEMNQGVGALIKGIKSQLEAFGFQVGQALEPVSMRVLEMIKGIDFTPIVTGATELAEKLVNVFEVVQSNWPQIVSTIKNVTIAVIAVSAAVATFKTLMAGMTIIAAINKLLVAYRAGTLVATAAQMGLNTAMWLSPTTWIIAGIAALIGIGVALALKWRSVAGSWSEVWRQMKSGAGTAVNFVIDGINALIKTINLIPGINIPIIPKVDWGESGLNPATYTTRSNQSKATSSGGMLASHYHGLDYVAYDGYTARLHKGEKILTAQEAKAYDEGKGGGVTVQITGNTMNFNNDVDIDNFAYRLAQGIAREAF